MMIQSKKKILPKTAHQRKQKGEEGEEKEVRFKSKTKNYSSKNKMKSNTITFKSKSTQKANINNMSKKKSQFRLKYINQKQGKRTTTKQTTFKQPK